MRVQLIKFLVGIVFGLLASAEARRDRIAFLVEQLKLKPVPPKVVDAIPDLHQPPRGN